VAGVNSKIASFSSPHVTDTQYIGVLLVTEVKIVGVAETFASTFTIISQSPGSVSFMTPVAGTKAGGTLISFGVTGFPNVDSAADIIVKLGSKTVTANSISLDATTGVLSVEATTPAGSAGTVTFAAELAACSAAQAESTFTFIDQSLPHLASDPSATTGSSVGGYPKISVNVARLSSSRDIVVKFGQVAGAPFELDSWSEPSTMLTVMPPEYQMGNSNSLPVTVSIYRRSEGIMNAATFTYTYTKAGAPKLTFISVQEGYSSGSTRVQVIIESFPKVIGACDVLVIFGTSVANVTAAASTTILGDDGVNQEQVTATFYSPAGSTGAVLVTITARGDTANAVTYTHNYLLAPKLEITSVTPSSISEAGGTIIVSMKNIPYMMPLGTTTGLIANIGGTVASSMSVLSATADETTLGIVLPANTVAGDAPLEMYLKENGPDDSAVAIVTYFDTNVATFVSASPMSGTVAGGELVYIKYNRYTAVHATTDYAVTFATTGYSPIATTVLAVSGPNGNGETTLTVRTPAGSQAGASTVAISVNARSISFTYTYLAATAPTVTAGPLPAASGLAGGTEITLSVKNLGTLAQSDVSVVFGSSPNYKSATVTEVKCSTSLCVIRFLTPVCTLSCGSTSAQLISNNNPNVAFSLNFFKECDYSEYCASVLDSSGLALARDVEALTASPPTSSICSTSYCKEKITYSPQMQFLGPKSGPITGGTKLYLSLQGFPPFKDSAVPTVYFGPSSDIKANGVSITQDVTSYTMTVTLPACSSGKVCNAVDGTSKITASHPDEFGTGWTSTNTDFTYQIVASGAFVIDSFAPATGLLSGGVVSMIMKLANFPTVSEVSPWSDVVVAVGTGADARTATVTNLLLLTSATAAPTAELQIMIPDGVSAGANPLKVTVGTTTVSATYTYIATAVASFNYVTPKQGGVAGGTVIQLSIKDLGNVAANALLVTFAAGLEATPSAVTLDSITGDSIVTVTTPALTAGQADRTLTGPGGISVTFAFEFVAATPFIDFIGYTKDGVRADAAISTQTSNTFITIVMDNWPMPAYADAKYTLCSAQSGPNSLVTDANVMTQVSASKTQFRFAAPACPAGSHTFTIEQQVASSWSVVFSSSTLSPTYAIPPLVLSTRRGTTSGGQTLQVEVYNLPLSDEASDLTLNWAATGSQTADGPITWVSSVVHDWTVFTVVTPERTAGTVTCTVFEVTAPSNFQTFEFEYVHAPSTVQPSASVVPSGAYNKATIVVVEVRDFPVTGKDGKTAATVADIQIASDVTITILSIAEVSFVSRTMLFTVRMPPHSTVGLVTATVSNKHFLTDGSTSFQFNYIQPAPLLMYMSPTQGSTGGSTVVTMEILDLAPITLTTDVAVTFTPTGSSGLLGTVNSIVWSDTTSTRITVTTPGGASPGNTSVAISRAGVVTYSTYMYIDTALLVLDPWLQTVSGLTSGGTSFQILIQAFPFIESASSVICKFSQGVAWESVATITGLTSNYTHTTITVNSPAFTRSGYAMPPSGTQVEVEVFAASDTNKRVFLPAGFTYYGLLQVSSVKYTPDYSSVLISLNQNAQLTLLGANFACSDIMTAATVTLLNADNCRPEGSSSIYAEISGTAISCTPIGSSLTFEAGTITASNGVGTLYVPGTVSLLDADLPKDAIAIVSGATTIGSCDPLKLDGSASTGRFVTYRWSCTNDNTLKTALEALTTASVTVAASVLTTAGKLYEVTLKVVDCHGKSSTVYSYPVYKSSQALPLVTIGGASQRTVESDKALQLEGNAEFSACSGQQALTFIWSVTSTPTVAFQATKGTLYVAAKALNPGTSYTFQLAAYPTSDPGNAGYAMVTVTAAYPDLTAQIKGGQKTSGTTGSAVILDGSKSSDPAASDTSGLSYAWACVDSSTGAACRTTTGALLNMGTASTASIGAGTLSPADLHFTLTTSDVASGRIAEASTRMNLVAQPVLSVSVVAFSKLGYSTKTGSTTIGYDTVAYNLILNPSEKLVLLATVTSGSTDTSVRSITWIEESYGLNLVTLASRQASSPNMLVISEDSLHAGAFYTFRATVAEGSTSGYATFNVLLNTPPSGGVCTVSPASGVTHTTDFTVLCNGYSDTESDTLKYTFGFETVINGTTTFTPAISQGSSNKWVFNVGTVGTSKIVARVYDDTNAFAYSSMTVSVSDSLAGSIDIAGDIDTMRTSLLGAALDKGDTSAALLTLGNLGTTLKDSTPSGGGRRLLSTSSEIAAVQSTLLGQLSTIVATTTAFTEDDIQLKVTPMETLTAGSAALSTTTLETTANMLTTLSAGRKAMSVSPVLGKSMVRVAANLLASIGTTPGSTPSTARNNTATQIIRTQLHNAYLRVAKGVLNSNAPGEPASDLSSDSANRLYARRMSRADLSSTNLSTASESAGAGMFVIPSQVTTLLPTEISVDSDDGGVSNAVDVFYTANSYVAQGSSTPDDYRADLNFISRVYGLTMSSAGSDDELSVSSLPSGGQFVIQMDKSDVTGPGSECRYWNSSTASFSQYGMYIVKETPSYVQCGATHLTDFIITAAASSTDLASNLFTMTPSTTATNTSVSFGFVLSTAFESGDTITFVLPYFLLKLELMSPTSCNSGTTTFTASTLNSGLSTAEVTLTASGTTLAKSSVCNVTIAEGVTTSSVAKPAEDATLKFTLANAEDIPPSVISAGTWLTNDLTRNILTLLNPVTTAPSTVTYDFIMNTHMLVGDMISIVLPDFALSSPGTPSTTGCGTTTFTTAGINSGTPTATLQLTAAQASLTALTSCVITITSGITTSGSAQAVNLAARTVEVTLASQSDIAATTIPSSTALETPEFKFSKLILHNPVTTAETPLSFNFSLNAPLEVGDAITLVIPDTTWAGSLGTITVSGCSSTTFTGTKAGSNSVSSSLTFTAATAAMPIDTYCYITLLAGATNGATPRPPNYAGRSMSVNFNNADNIGSTDMPDTSSLTTPDAPTSTLYIYNPVTEAPTQIAYEFSLNAPLAIGDVVIITVPDFIFGTLPLVQTVGCASTSFSALSTGSNSAIAKLYFTASANIMPANTLCKVVFVSGITTGANAQDADFADRNLYVQYAGLTDLDQAIKVSPALTVPALSSTSLIIGTPTTASATLIEFAFQCSAPMETGDTLHIFLPTFTFGGTFGTTSTTGCGTSTFLASSSVANTMTLTVGTAGMAANTACVVTIPSGTTAGLVAQIVNLSTRTAAATLASATNTVTATISSSTAVTDVTPPQVTIFAPAHQAMGVNAGTNIQLTFNEVITVTPNQPIYLKSVTGTDTIIASSGAEITTAGATYTINPFGATATKLEFGVQYGLVFGSGIIADAQGNTHAGFTLATYWFTTGPSITTFSPAQNALGANPTTDIVLTFSEDVQQGVGSVTISAQKTHSMVTTAIPSDLVVPINDGQVSIVGAVVTINPTNSLTNEMTYNVSFPSGTLKDVNNNPYTGLGNVYTPSLSYQFSADTIAPVMAAYLPANGGTEVPKTTSVTLTFSEPVKEGAGSVVFVPTTGTPLDIIYVDIFSCTFSGPNVTIVPTQDLMIATYGMLYKVTVGLGVITDLNNNPFSGLIGTSYQFTTTIDTTPPVIVSYLPVQNATGIPASTNIVITFDEPIQAGTGNIMFNPGEIVTPGAAYRLETPSTPLSIPAGDSQVTYSGNTVTVNPTATLLEIGVTYSITLAVGVIRDIAVPAIGQAGNLHQGLDLNVYMFTIPDTSLPTISGYAPPQNAPNAPPRENLVLTFSETVQLTGSGVVTIVPSCTTSNIHYPCSTTVINMNDVAQVSVSGNNLIIDPVMNLLITGQGVPYTVTLSAGAVTDTSGNVFGGVLGTTWQFTSEGDTKRPSILSFSPQQGGTEVPEKPNLILIFDESVQAGTGSITLTPQTGSPVAIPVTDKQVSFSASMVLINPTLALAAAQTFTMTIPYGVIQDTYGFNAYMGLGDTGLAQPTYTFTVASSGNTVKVSFVNTSSTAGYMVDNGQAYGYRNGYYYGWKCSGTPYHLSVYPYDNNMQTFGAYFDRYDQCASTSWEIAVANGFYDITVILPQGNHGACTIEGTLSGGTTETPFTYTATNVEVIDGAVTLAGDFPTCTGVQEIQIAAPSGEPDNGCANKLDGKVCGPMQELHLLEGECMTIVKPASSACNRELTSGTEPLNPVSMYPTPDDPRLVPILRF